MVQYLHFRILEFPLTDEGLHHRKPPGSVERLSATPVQSQGHLTKLRLRQGLVNTLRRVAGAGGAAKCTVSLLAFHVISLFNSGGPQQRWNGGLKKKHEIQPSQDGNLATWTSTVAVLMGRLSLHMGVIIKTYKNNIKTHADLFINMIVCKVDRQQHSRS